ncbi:AIR synthase family protein [Conexivisphaera calida]|uniref:AIR synthase family protein n=1 Tax=Conexivisphaera calida TaxID=1874277 RepID=UPI00157B8F73|nr:AIR synthase family protein [Conexivisphaera calida]
MAKPPVSSLRRYVFPRSGAKRDDVLSGPGVGLDVGIARVGGGRAIVSHSDPVHGAVRHVAWLAVHVASNDVATAGVPPAWILPTILLPPTWDDAMLDELTSQVDSAARELGAAVIGGHTGVVEGLSRPLVVATSIGVGEEDRILTAAGARPGDAIYMTKWAALEGTAILAEDFEDLLLRRGVPRSTISSASGLMSMVSVVPEALALASAGAVHAMHDPTRGGIAEGLAEMAFASSTYIEVWEDRIPLLESTLEFSSALGFDPLWMISSGVLLFASPPGMREAVERALSGTPHAEIGVVRGPGPRVLMHRRSGRDEVIEEVHPERDELAEVWRRNPR